MSTKHKEQGLKACMSASVNWKKFRRNYKKEEIWEFDIAEICDNLILLLNDKENNGMAALLGKPKERLSTASKLTLGILRIYQQQVKDAYDETCDSLRRIPKIVLSKKDWSLKSEFKKKNIANKSQKLSELDETVDISKILDFSTDVNFEWKSDEWSVNGESFEAMTEQDFLEFQRLQESPSPKSLERLRVCSTPIEHVSFPILGCEAPLNSRTCSFKTPSPGLKIMESYETNAQTEAFLQFSSEIHCQSPLNLSSRKYFKTKTIIQRFSMRDNLLKLRFKSNLFRTTNTRTKSRKLQKFFERVIRNCTCNNYTPHSTKFSMDLGILHNFTGSVFNASDDSSTLSGIFELVRTPFIEDPKTISNNFNSWAGDESGSLRSMITAPDMFVCNYDTIFSRSIRMCSLTPSVIEAPSYFDETEKSTTDYGPLRSSITHPNTDNALSIRDYASVDRMNEENNVERFLVSPDVRIESACSSQRTANRIAVTAEKTVSIHKPEVVNFSSHAAEKGAGDFLEEPIPYFMENLSFEKQNNDNALLYTQSSLGLRSPHKGNASVLEHATRMSTSPYHNRGILWISPRISSTHQTTTQVKQNAEGKHIQNEEAKEKIDIDNEICSQQNLTKVQAMQIAADEDDKFDTLFEGTRLNVPTETIERKEFSQHTKLFPLRSCENLLNFESRKQSIQADRTSLIPSTCKTVKNTRDALKRCYPCPPQDKTHCNKGNEGERDQILDFSQTKFSNEQFSSGLAVVAESSINAMFQTPKINQIEGTSNLVPIANRTEIPCRKGDLEDLRENFQKSFKTKVVSMDLLPRDPTSTRISKTPTAARSVLIATSTTACDTNDDERESNQTSEKSKNISKKKNKSKKATKENPRKKRKITRKGSCLHSENPCNSPFTDEYNVININEPSFRGDWNTKAILRKLCSLWESEVYPINMIILTKEAKFRAEAAIAFHSVLVLNAAQRIVLLKCGTKLEIYHIAKGNLSGVMLDASNFLENLEY